MEGVGDNGHLYFLERPTPEAIQSRLWLLLIDAEQKKEEYKDRLQFKVDELKRKEEDLLVWEDNVANREWKVENGEDNIASLMREIKLKDILLANKTNELNKKNRELEDCFREARADVRREMEVC